MTVTESAPHNPEMNQQTALYYAQIACDKMILTSRIQLEFYTGINRLGEDQQKMLKELMEEYEAVKEYLKENLK